MAGFRFATPTPRPRTADLAKFFGHVKVAPSGCWVWRERACNDKGYGNFRDTTAHRWSHAWFIGVIPKTFEVDHLCHVRACVNPAHLEAVTNSENKRRSGLWWARGLCKNGHDFTAANTYWSFRKGVQQRTCRKCRMVSRRRWCDKQIRYRQATRHLRLQRAS